MALTVVPVMAADTKSDTWQIVDHDCDLRILERVETLATEKVAAHSRLKMRAGHGTYAYAARRIAPTPIIAETNLRVPFRSSTQGQQLLIRVVFPRTVNDKRATPLSTLVGGTTYDRANTWRELTLKNFPVALEQHVRVLRSRHPGVLIDAREAYIDLVLVNVFAGVGTADAWLGEPIVSGALAVTDRGAYGAIQPVSYLSTEESERKTVRIELSANIMLIDGRPFFPRVVDDRGEDWSYLKALGFNTIRLRVPPTATMINRAEALGLWLVAPPPVNWSGGDLSKFYRRVLVWDAGQSLGRNELESTSQLVRRIRNSDLRVMRPFICNAEERVADFGRQSSLQLHSRNAIGSTFDLDDYSAWLGDRVALAGRSTMSWATIQTEPLSATLRQLASLGVDERTATLDSEQIQRMTWLAIAAGMRGLVFESRERLDSDSINSRNRAVTLQRLNEVLRLIQPWLASGQFFRASTGNGAESQYDVSVIRTERAWLALAIRKGDGGLGMQAPLELTVPGVPISSEAFAILDTRLQRLKQSRVTGGCRFTFRDPQPINLVVVTRDPRMIGNLEQELSTRSETRAELNRELTSIKLNLADQAAANLPEQSVPTQARRVIAVARSEFSACQRAFEQGQFAQVIHSAGRSLSLLSNAQRLMLNESPLAMHNSAFDDHSVGLKLAGRLRQRLIAGSGIDTLDSGRCEDLATMQQSGWQVFRDQQVSAVTNIGISRDRPRHGQSCLRLSAAGATLDETILVESPPLWVTSPAVTLRAGDLVRISGWVRVERPLGASRDGVMVFDSVGGIELAERITLSKEWSRFSMLRTVDSSMPINVTIALTGLGTIDVDEVQITRFPIESPSER